MSDALSLLRASVKAKRDFHEDDDKIIFGDLYYPKSVKTTYLIYGTGKDGKPKDYYTLECLAFLIKNRELQHPMYVKNAGTRNISVVSRPDRRELLSYLDGEVDTLPSIDKNAPFEIAMQRPLPYVKSSGSGGISSQLQQQQQQQQQQLPSTSVASASASSLLSSSALKRPLGSHLTSGGGGGADPSQFDELDHASTNKQARFGAGSDDLAAAAAAAAASGGAESAKERLLGRIAKKFDETAAQSSRPITDNIMPLSDTLTTEKIAMIKAKKKAQQRKQVASGVDDMDVDELSVHPATAAAAASASASSQHHHHSHHPHHSTQASKHQPQAHHKHLFDGLLGPSQHAAAAAGSRSSSTASGFVAGLAATSTTSSAVDENDSVMREIAERECVCRNRVSVLQSTGKNFEKEINAFLQIIKAKEAGAANAMAADAVSAAAAAATSAASAASAPTAASQAIASSSASASASSQIASQQQQQQAVGYNRFDQERYAAKDETGGFSIDTTLTYQPNGGSIALSSAPKSLPSSSSTQQQQQQQQSSTSSSSSSTQHRQSTGSSVIGKPITPGKSPGGSSSQVQRHVRPIIIIPATTTSLINMNNASDILQELKYVPWEEKKRASAVSQASQQRPGQQVSTTTAKDAEIIMHKRDDGIRLEFKVVDNVHKLAPADWDRVVAVFVHGKQWQFKDWPSGYTNPAEIFNKVKGFHLKMSGIPLDPNISRWSVSVIELDPHKRHLDRARLLAFWEELNRFILKTKPQLSGRI